MNFISFKHFMTSHFVRELPWSKGERPWWIDRDHFTWARLQQFKYYLLEQFWLEKLEEISEIKWSTMLDSLPIWSQEFWSKLWVTREEMEAKFEADLYKWVDNLAESIKLWEWWVQRLIVMNREKLVTILSNNTWLTDWEKQDLLSRNSDVKSWEMLQNFDLRRKERELLMSFILSWYGEWFSWQIEHNIKKSKEFKAAYEFIIRERLFNERYTAANAKTSTVYEWRDANRARWVDWPARGWVTHH